MPKYPPKKSANGFLAAAAVGYLCKHNATLSGSGRRLPGGDRCCLGDGGGADCAGTRMPNQVVANAAESALQHHLGMTCDPVAGFVQVPCIERCAFGAVKAWTAS